MTTAQSAFEERGGRVARGIGALAIGIGGVIAASVASIVTFSATGGRGPFPH